jgi:hypothetical protein
MMLDAAIGYAQLGLPVLPLWTVLPSITGDDFICACGSLRCENQGKHPMARLVPHGVKDATTDEAKVRHFWTSAPRANIGIATGRGRIVVDVDGRSCGNQTLAALEQKHGQLPATWRAVTGNGVHVYFTSDMEIRNSVGRVGAGLDVRGDGGFVVAPPSIHISGKRYSWQQAPDQTQLAPMPSWLLAAVQQTPSAKTAAPAATWRELVKQGVGEGRRNDVVTRLAGHLLRREVDALVVFEIMTTWNAVRCRPPLGEDEIAGIVARIAERELKRRGEVV